VIPRNASLTARRPRTTQRAPVAAAAAVIDEKRVRTDGHSTAPERTFIAPRIVKRQPATACANDVGVTRRNTCDTIIGTTVRSVVGPHFTGRPSRGGLDRAVACIRRVIQISHKVTNKDYNDDDDDVDATIINKTAGIEDNQQRHSILKLNYIIAVSVRKSPLDGVTLSVRTTFHWTLVTLTNN